MKATSRQKIHEAQELSVWLRVIRPDNEQTAQCIESILLDYCIDLERRSRAKFKHADQTHFDLIVLSRTLAEGVMTDLQNKWAWELRRWTPYKNAENVQEIIISFLLRMIEEFRVSELEMGYYLQQPCFPDLDHALLEDLRLYVN